MDLSEKEWDEAKQFGQYLLNQGEDESEAVVEFRRQDLAAYLGMLGFCHKGSDDVQLDATKSTAAPTPPADTREALIAARDAIKHSTEYRLGIPGYEALVAKINAALGETK